MTLLRFHAYFLLACLGAFLLDKIARWLFARTPLASRWNLLPVAWWAWPLAYVLGWVIVLTYEMMKGN